MIEHFNHLLLHLQRTSECIVGRLKERIMSRNSDVMQLLVDMYR